MIINEKCIGCKRDTCAICPVNLCNGCAEDTEYGCIHPDPDLKLIDGKCSGYRTTPIEVKIVHYEPPKTDE